VTTDNILGDVALMSAHFAQFVIKLFTLCCAFCGIVRRHYGQIIVVVLVTVQTI